MQTFIQKISSKYLQIQGLSLHASQLWQFSRNSWQLHYVKSHCAYKSLMLQSDEPVLSLKSSLTNKQKNKKTTTAAVTVGGRKKSDRRGTRGSQTGLSKCPPTLHDPCSRGPVTVVCQFNQVGGEAIVCQLVLAIKSTCRRDNGKLRICQHAFFI